MFHCMGIAHFLYAVISFPPIFILTLSNYCSNQAFPTISESAWLTRNLEDRTAFRSPIPIILDHHLNASLSSTWPHVYIPLHFFLPWVFFSQRCVYSQLVSPAVRIPPIGVYTSLVTWRFMSCTYTTTYTLWHDASVPSVSSPSWFCCSSIMLLCSMGLDQNVSPTILLLSSGW